MALSINIPVLTFFYIKNFVQFLFLFFENYIEKLYKFKYN